MCALSLLASKFSMEKLSEVSPDFSGQKTMVCVVVIKFLAV